MKILDKVKDVWKKIFNKKDEIKALPAATNIQNTHNFYREDGSNITISPVLDRTGNQLYEQVLNHRTGELQNIAKYSVYSPEMQQLTGSDIETILIDLDSKLLQDSNYSNYVVNTLLSPERISKIVNQYENYAGGISVNESGEITGKFVDNGIIKGLTASRQENFQRYQQEQAARDAAYRNEIRSNAANHSVEYKTNHAEDLSQYNDR